MHSMRTQVHASASASTTHMCMRIRSRPMLIEMVLHTVSALCAAASGAACLVCRTICRTIYCHPCEANPTSLPLPPPKDRFLFRTMCLALAGTHTRAMTQTTRNDAKHEGKESDHAGKETAAQKECSHRVLAHMHTDASKSNGNYRTPACCSVLQQKRVAVCCSKSKANYRTPHTENIHRQEWAQHPHACSRQGHACRHWHASSHCNTLQHTATWMWALTCV